MEWKLAESTLAETQMPDGYRLTRMRSDDVRAVIEKLAAWYPDIRVGMESPHLSADFYFEETSLEGQAETPVLPLVVRHTADGVVAVITYEKNALARSITSRLVLPRHLVDGIAVWLFDGHLG